MASIEVALVELENAFKTRLPVHLKALETEWKDGIRLEPLRMIEWEEVREISVTPAVLMVGTSESDPNLRDQLFDATVLCYFILMDKSRNMLTRKLYRYAEAVRRMIREVPVRTLNQKVVSAKIERIDYSPLFTDRDNLYGRDFQASIQLRMLKE